MSKVIWIVCFLWCWPLVADAVEIDRDHWRELKKGMHYKRGGSGEKEEYFQDWSKDVDEEKSKRKGSGYTPSQRKKKDYLKSKPRNVSEPQPKSADETEISDSVVYLIYIIVLVILLVVVYFLFFNNKRRSDKKIILPVKDEIQVDIPFNELEELLSKAIQHGNYREAVRIYFIFIIKTLRDKSWINWEKKKTNAAYLFEMRNRRQFDSFSEAVLIFEIVWYGHRDIAKEQYDQIKPKMEALLQSLKKES